MKSAKGHSGLIANIYRSHLDAWFKGALSEMDYLMAKMHFGELGEADEVLFSQMLSISDSISTEARAVEDLTLEGKWEEARERVLASRRDLRSMERVLGDTMDRLSDLKSEFIALSGAPRLQGI